MWSAGSHLWKSVVQHPGSRGGHPWWDGHTWRYDEPPHPHTVIEDDDPLGDPSELFTNEAEATDEERRAYEEEVERELRTTKRHDDAAIRKFIMHRGIRRSDKDQNGDRYFNAEYNDYVPVWARNQANGLTLDQMRRELQEEYPYLELETIDDLLVFLEHFEDTRTKKSWHAGSHAWEKSHHVQNPGSRHGHIVGYDAHGEPIYASELTREVERQATQRVRDASQGAGGWEGVHGWTSGYHLELDPSRKTITATIRLGHSRAAQANGVPHASPESRRLWEDSVAASWNHRAALKIGDTPYPVHVRLVWDDENPHYGIWANTGEGRNRGTSSMTHWGTEDNENIPHEVGHMLGNKDEYFTVDDVPHGAPYQRAGSIMNNPRNAPELRHYAPIAEETAHLLNLSPSAVAIVPYERIWENYGNPPEAHEPMRPVPRSGERAATRSALKILNERSRRQDSMSLNADQPARLIGPKLGVSEEDARRACALSGWHPATAKEASTRLGSWANALAFIINVAWMYESTNEFPANIALQHAVADVLPDTVPPQKPTHVDSESWEKGVALYNDPIYREATQAFARTVYDETQRTLSQAGITHLALLRGVNRVVHPAVEEAGREGGTVPFEEITDNSITSWATNVDDAHYFSQNGDDPDERHHAVIMATVPAERIFGTYATGIGHKGVQEILVLTGPGEVHFVTGAGLPLYVRASKMAKKTARKSWSAGGHAFWEPLEKKIGKKILHPGSRGGKGYWNREGTWVYGERPVTRLVPRSLDLEHTENRLVHLLREHGIETAQDFQQGDQSKVAGDIYYTLIKEGHSEKDIVAAWKYIRQQAEQGASDYKTITWNQDTLDNAIKNWLHEHGVKPGHEGDALAHLSKDRWQDIAEAAAGPEPNPYYHNPNSIAQINEQRAKARKEALERIMELRYHLLYEESPEEPAPDQLSLMDLGPEDRTRPARGEARRFHDLLSATDRFNETPRDVLPLDLAMDPEIGPALSKLSQNARTVLGPLYNHAFNVNATAALATLAQDDIYGVPTEMKYLREMREQFGDPLTAEEIKKYLQKEYETSALYKLHNSDRWSLLAHDLRGAGMTDLADAIDDAFRAPERTPLPDNPYPYSAEIDPKITAQSEDLYRTWVDEIDELSYDMSPSEDSIQIKADDLYQDIYNETLESLVSDYKSKNQDEYEEIWDQLAEQYAHDYLDVEDYTSPGDSEEDAHNKMMAEARLQTEGDADTEFEDRAKESVEGRASELASESAWEQATESASEEEAEPKVKAKIAVMNALGRRLEEDHDISASDARRFFSIVSTYPDDDHTQNAEGCSTTVAGLADVLVGAWAGSSDGHNPLSNAMMIMAGRVFPGAPSWEEKPPHTNEFAWKQALGYVQDEHFQHVAESFLRSMYDHTQQVLKDQGITHVVIGRGIQTFPDEITKAILEGSTALEAAGHSSGFITGTHEDVYTNPMSSWGFAQAGAGTINQFAGPGIMLIATVPAERVLGSFRTGYGCYEEEEVVPIGGTGTVRWIAHHNAENRAGMLQQAARGQHFTPPARQIRPEGPNSYRYFSITEPGVVYDADSKKVIRATLTPAEEEGNAKAREHNEKVDREITERHERMRDILRGAGIDPTFAPQNLLDNMTNLLNNPTLYALPSNKNLVEQQLQQASANVLTDDQAEALYHAMFPQKGWSSRRLQEARSWSRQLARRLAKAHVTV